MLASKIFQRYITVIIILFSFQAIPLGKLLCFHYILFSMELYSFTVMIIYDTVNLSYYVFFRLVLKLTLLQFEFYIK